MKLQLLRKPGVLLLAALLALAVRPTPVRSDDPPVDLALFEQALFDLVNEEREGHGLPPLRHDDRLQQAARRHSRAMAEGDFFNHVWPDGTTLARRLSDAGYAPALAWAENIAVNFLDPAELVEAFMGSADHRANILGWEFADTGCGAVYLNGRLLFTQVFGALQPPPPPEPPPAAPSNLRAKARANLQVRLTWRDRSRNEVGFILERRTATTEFIRIGEGGLSFPNVRSFIDTGLQARTRYTYRLRSFNDDGASPAIEVSVTTKAR